MKTKGKLKMPAVSKSVTRSVPKTKTSNIKKKHRKPKAGITASYGGFGLAQTYY